MTTLDLSIVVDAPNDRVWEVLADFGGVATWNPNVKRSKLTSTGDVGAGITRECVLAPMGTVQERVTEWSDGRLLGIEIFDHKNVPALRSAIGTFELTPQGDQTLVRMRFDYTVGLGAMGKGMNALGMKRSFTKSLGQLLAGLKYYAETGEPAEKKSQLQAAAVQSAA